MKNIWKNKLELNTDETETFESFVGILTKIKIFLTMNIIIHLSTALLLNSFIDCIVTLLQLHLRTNYDLNVYFIIFDETFPSSIDMKT